MKSLFFFALFFGSATLFAEEPNPQCPALLRFSMESLEGQNKVNFCDAYRGKVILAVNTASQCGYTPQLGGLQQLYLEYKSKGLVVLGFPSGDFKQEHSNPAETAKVAREQYGVSFPLFAKSSVSGASANGFFEQLARQSGVTPQWNFQKYLIDRNGQVVEVFPSQVAPDDVRIRSAIESLLK